MHLANGLSTGERHVPPSPHVRPEGTALQALPTLPLSGTFVVIALGTHVPPVGGSAVTEWYFVSSFPAYGVHAPPLASTAVSHGALQVAVPYLPVT
jgi:hypothetical protein